MSIICAYGCASGLFCDGSPGCKFGAGEMPEPKIKTWAERLAEEQAKQKKLYVGTSPQPPAAKWNPHDKEREATTYAGNVVALLGALIQKLSTGSNYDSIEIDLKSASYHFNKLAEIILPTFEKEAMPNDWELGNNTLPADVKVQIENEAEYRASLQFHKKYSHDQWTACVITYRQGAIEWASKLHHLHQEYDRVKNQLKTVSANVSVSRINGNTLALALRRLSRSVSVHPEFANNTEWGDYVSGAEKALTIWEGEKEAKE